MITVLIARITAENSGRKQCVYEIHMELKKTPRITLKLYSKMNLERTLKYTVFAKQMFVKNPDAENYRFILFPTDILVFIPNHQLL